MVQWSHCKYYSMDQRGQKPGDLYSPESSPQASTQMSSSPVTSPTQSPAPSPVTSLSSVCTGLSPLPVLTQFPRPGGPAQGDGRYSLLGQPLQYNLSICPPLLHGQSAYSVHQGQSGLKHGNRSKRQALKSASTDLGTTDVVLGRVLEVTDLPEGITRTKADKLFTQLAMSGAKIQWLKDAQGLPGGGGGDNGGTAENGRHSDLAALYTIVAVFPSPLAAQNASLRLNNSFCDNGACKAVTQYSQYQDCDPLVKCKGHGKVMLAIIALDGAVYFLSNPICLVLTFGGAKKLEYAGSTNTVHNFLSNYLGRRECRNLHQKSAVVTAVSLTDSETARLQITVPRKIETNTKDGSISETHVSYSIQIDKKTYIFPLEKQSFLDSNLLVYSYNKSGVLYPDSSFIKGHCFYQGYATEIPNSAATLSTCSGLRGLLQFENVSYGIEPLESSTTYEHVIYPFRDKKSDFSPISENSSTTQFADQSYKILVKSNKDSGVLLKRVLKMRVIIDKALYDYMGSEVTLASEKIIYVFSLINTMYSQLQVSVILTSLEIWSDLNKISTDGDAHEVLQRFVSWREKNLLQSSHDLTYLLIRSHGIKFFSSCSIDEFKHTTSQPKLECLQNQTVPKVFPQGRQSICGNGVLEPNEQCDCGATETCEYSKCCDPLNCVLKGKAECGSGPCCGKNTCKIFERGRECRKSTDPCDFPEFCNGLSEFCAPDMRAADLQTCNNKSSYCFGGICRDRTKQCIVAREASYQCTEEVNFQNDPYGNCLGRACTFRTNTVHNLLSKYLGRRECRNLYQKSAVVTAVSLTDFETARLQITVPRKIETNTKDGSISETHVSYSIQIDKKTYTFPLEKQSFLDSNLLVYSYNKSGVLYPDSSFIKGHCFYQGYAIEIPNSAATLSICSGLRGLLQFENVSYGIEPLESSTTYEHVIYPFRDKKSDFSPISENSSTTQFADQSYKILVKSNKDSGVPLKRVLKIRVIIDKALYDYMGSEVTLASEKIIYVFSLINTMYSQLQVSVILTSLEIWSYLNKISTDGDAHEVLQRFVSWREKNLLQSSHDLTYLLIRSHGIKFFSSCSIDEFKHTTSQPKLECLQNQTVPKVFPQGRQSICGNGVLEPPEQCDCGTMETCEYSKCCDPLNCVLKGKADCGSGPCCGKNTCKILDRGRECRKSTDPCDFPEFCNGVSEFCAPDMRAADLQTCNNKSSYCFGGICQDRTTQCINLFGKCNNLSFLLSFIFKLYFF
ncbi:hypothetical protein JEQ12_013261 [Ovis aries]|uniref:Disintegrin and metalloproteinase domain-containing protein 18 n=1 Tax=Ovis aries TaxID=9940 RepID=A0A835ZN86_SHEEP|nr:hypothetical protein JEQ12_013261 [Ovis aries]